MATLAPTEDVVQTVRGLGGGTLGGFIVIVLALGLIVVNSTNIYGGTISTMTIIQDFTSTATKRTIVALIIGTAAVVVGIAGSADFITNLTNYLNFVLMFLIPWTAINLLDFYVIHHGNYNTDDFFTKHGTFGKWGAPAIITYFVAFAAQLPFMNTTLYQGPVAEAMGGVDLAWLVGTIVAIPLYLFLAKRKLKLRRLDLDPHYSVASTASSDEVDELRAEGQQ